MYISKHLDEQRGSELHRVIREFPLDILVVHEAEGLDANHIPFELADQQGQQVLLAHVARANSVWSAVKDGDDALVIFRAVDAYMSPNCTRSHRRH